MTAEQYHYAIIVQATNTAGEVGAPFGAVRVAAAVTDTVVDMALAPGLAGRVDSVGGAGVAAVPPAASASANATVESNLE